MLAERTAMLVGTNSVLDGGGHGHHHHRWRRGRVLDWWRRGRRCWWRRRIEERAEEEWGRPPVFPPPPPPTTPSWWGVAGEETIRRPKDCLTQSSFCLTRRPKDCLTQRMYHGETRLSSCSIILIVVGNPGPMVATSDERELEDSSMIATSESWRTARRERNSEEDSEERDALLTTLSDVERYVECRATSM